MSTKLVIVVRKDLNMRKGKMCGQVGHAVQAVVMRLLEERERRQHPGDVQDKWLDDGLSSKVVVGCQGHRDFLEIIEAAGAAGLDTYVVTDVGKTEFHGQMTTTCVAIGPDLAERLDPITGKLPLL